MKANPTQIPRLLSKVMKKPVQLEKEAKYAEIEMKGKLIMRYMSKSSSRE